jgi:hypothetical protein
MDVVDGVDTVDAASGRIAETTKVGGGFGRWILFEISDLRS